MDSWLYRMEYKYGRHAIPNLMRTVVIGMALVYVADLLNPVVSLQSYLYLSRSALAHGQVWRLLTFIFLPPSAHPLLILINLYFYYWIGATLENSWGAFRFNIYYLCGMVGAIIACLITGAADNSFLNLSLFFAFAALHPDMRVLLFFFIPIKVKWLAWADGALYLVSFILGSWPTRAAIVMSLINFLVFFGPAFLRSLRQSLHDRRMQREWRRRWRR